MSTPEFPLTPPLGPERNSLKDTYSFAFELNGLLVRYGYERDQGYHDVAWGSVSLNMRFILNRYTIKSDRPEEPYDTKIFHLRIFDGNQSDEDEEPESIITFSPGRGVTKIEGPMLSTFQQGSVGPDEVYKRAYAKMIEYINNYDS